VHFAPFDGSHDYIPFAEHRQFMVYYRQNNTEKECGTTGMGGHTMIKLPKIALGTWAWGNDGTFGTAYAEDQLRSVFDSAMQHGLTLWDTAYAYGIGTAEKTLGAFLKGRARDSFLLSDKLTPQCMDESSASPVADMWAMQKKLLGTDSIDIYWVHNATEAPQWIERLAAFFEKAEHTPIIGVSNHNMGQIEEADAVLQHHGLKLGAVQNHFSLINRSSEEAGILDYCHKKDIAFFSYMVLEQGALTGHYSTLYPMPADAARAAVGVVEIGASLVRLAVEDDVAKRAVLVDGNAAVVKKVAVAALVETALLVEEVDVLLQHLADGALRHEQKLIPNLG